MYLSFFEMLFLYTHEFIGQLKCRFDYGGAQEDSMGPESAVWKMTEVAVRGFRLPGTHVMRFTLRAKLAQTLTGMHSNHGETPPSYGSTVASSTKEVENMLACFYAVSFVQALHDTMKVQEFTMDQFCDLTGMSKVDFEMMYVLYSFDSYSSVNNGPYVSFNDTCLLVEYLKLGTCESVVEHHFRLWPLIANPETFKVYYGMYMVLMIDPALVAVRDALQEVPRVVLELVEGEVRYTNFITG